MDVVELRAFLTQLRVELGLSQAEIGKRAGVNGSAVSLWESGGRNPPLDSIERWAATMGIKVSLEPRPIHPTGEGNERLAAIASAVEVIESASLEEVRALRLLLDMLRIKRP